MGLRNGQSGTYGIQEKEDMQKLVTLEAQKTQDLPIREKQQAGWKAMLWQIWCFGLVGGANTILDLLALNGLLFLFPTNQVWLILLYNILAYSFGALNSFFLNKYWTFKNYHRATWPELSRFVLTTLMGMGSNTALVWLASFIPHAFIVNTVVWTNVSKVAALVISALVSYLGMRLWVFVRHHEGRK
jgi:putative flippase GtrA